ncbi:LacI family DNA-binding transcriptional regulator [Paraburkholderia tagetis]|uniref:LacI family DNA-binding transcriptional regulator n=1 Tax=Paraburkholderia tagetis TaxID=2913261 RepID=A0A9X1ULN1_9BURK|nr:LacI family DNA-binding transcriptional regulator [Paraburkholderia tagetis]MCG5077512.1 LacI family DNA-binding transcriptional regulator [Paraburkholderia tagetis]
MANSTTQFFNTSAASHRERETDSSTSRQRRKKAPRFAEIAAEAGVSESTVDRVLNERGRVSYQARDKVIVAAMRLGVRRVLPEMWHGLRHIDVIMPINSTPMFQRLDYALRRSIQMLDRHIVVHRLTLKRDDDVSYAKAISSPPYRRSGLIVVGDSNERTLDAINEALGRGERVVSMVTELPNSLYVGVDNCVAGRTAAHMIGKLTRGKGRVLLLRGPYGAPDHEQRVIGFVRELKQAHPFLELEIAPQDTKDDADVCFRLVEASLNRGPLDAIYNTGCGNLGIREALRRRNLLGKLVWVAHEMHQTNAELLRHDHINLVIDQNPDAQVLYALQSVLSDDASSDLPKGNAGHTDISLFTMANVPEAPYTN